MNNLTNRDGRLFSNLQDGLAFLNQLARIGARTTSLIRIPYRDLTFTMIERAPIYDDRGSIVPEILFTLLYNHVVLRYSSENHRERISPGIRRLAQQLVDAYIAQVMAPFQPRSTPEYITVPLYSTPPEPPEGRIWVFFERRTDGYANGDVYILGTINPSPNFNPAA